jgi:DAK2 domain fusion protein YloV
VLESLDAAAIHRWCAAAVEALRKHQREIDDLNVYPVPDGDTGTNLVLTLTSAQQALDHTEEASVANETEHGRALRLMARGALLGARGNSGVIVSQILRGMADDLADVKVVRGVAFAAAMRRAAEAAYRAVSDPVEGTILSVAAASASAATDAAHTDDLACVVRAAAGAAGDALARTPEQLPVLARAGVVDAGGRGLVVLLDALLQVVTGEAPHEPPPMRSVRRPLTAAREAGSDEYGYEVQYLLDATSEAVDGLKTVLSGLGDSLVVVGAGGGAMQTWNVHVHVNDVGAAIEAGVEAGRPHRISVVRFADQMAVDSDARAVVVVAPGDGLAELFASEGAVVVGATPSTVEILDAVRSTRAGQVVVLPNDPNSQAVAATAGAEAAADGIAVRVVPTRCSVQALAALAVRDTGRPFEDDVIAMAEAAGTCRYAEVTIASREALTVVGLCRPGDVLALVEGEVNLIGTDLTQTCRDLLDRMLAAGGELVTLILGADGPDGLGEALTGHVTQVWPFAEVQVYTGGQPHYPLLVGVE